MEPRSQVSKRAGLGTSILIYIHSELGSERYPSVPDLGSCYGMVQRGWASHRLSCSFFREWLNFCIQSRVRHSLR